MKGIVIDMDIMRFKKMTAWVLIAVMCIGLMPVYAFAEEPEPEDKISIVVMGNSTTTGYGMPDYNGSRSGFSLRNNDLDHYPLEEAKTIKQGRLSGAAYPYRLKRYIAENVCGGEMDKVQLDSFGLNGMRINEVLAFLDSDFYKKSTEREAAYKQKWDEEHTNKAGSGFLTSRERNYISAFYNCGAITENAYDAANAYVKETVADADVIVLDAANNNFGTYIGFRLAAYSGIGYSDSKPNTYETISDVEGLPDWLRSSITEIMDGVSDKVLKNDFAKQIIDAYMYATADCIMNYSATIEAIREINPDAKIICVGISNPNKDMAIQLGSIRVALGDMLGELYSLVDLYMRGMDKNSGSIYYADLGEGLPSIGASIAEKDSLEDVFADGPRDGLLRNEKGEVVTNEFGNAYTDVRSNYGIHEMFQREDGSGFNRDYLGGIFSNDPVEGGKIFYNTVLAPSFAKNGIVLKAWDEMDDGDIITGTREGVPATFYVTFDFSTADVSKALNADMTGNSHPIAKITDEDTTVYLTKKNVDKVVYRIYNVLYEGVKHNTIDVASVAAMMADRNSMSLDLMRYIFGAEDSASDDTLGLLYMLVRFVMSDAIGEHPDTVGCGMKYDAVLSAYLSETPASEEVKELLNERLKQLYEKLLEIKEKIEKNEKYQKIMEELKPIIEEIKAIGIAVYALPEYEKAVDAIAETLDLLAQSISELQDDADGLEQQNAELLKQVGDLQTEISGLATQIQEAKEKSDEIAKESDEYEKEIARLNAMVKELEETMDALEFAQKKVTLKKITAGKKSFTATWKKLSGANGYQVSYKVGKKTSKKTVKGGSKTKLTVKKLKSGKKYTVKVRAYKTVKGKKVYSKWSSAKKVTVK